MKRQRCYRLRCLSGWSPCITEWIDDELWAICADCQKRRLLLVAKSDGVLRGMTAND